MITAARFTHRRLISQKPTHTLTLWLITLNHRCILQDLSQAHWTWFTIWLSAAMIWKTFIWLTLKRTASEFQMFLSLAQYSHYRENTSKYWWLYWSEAAGIRWFCTWLKLQALLPLCLCFNQLTRPLWAHMCGAFVTLHKNRKINPGQSNL